jgi:hypothetical protein
MSGVYSTGASDSLACLSHYSSKRVCVCVHLAFLNRDVGFVVQSVVKIRTTAVIMYTRSRHRDWLHTSFSSGVSPFQGVLYLYFYVYLLYLLFSNLFDNRQSRKLSFTPITNYSLADSMMSEHMSLNILLSQCFRYYGVCKMGIPLHADHADL